MDPRTKMRRVFSVLASAAVCTVATIVGGIAPAYAAADGFLLMKGTGSVYTDANIVYLGITPGVGTKTFSFKVVNLGSSSQQFKVTVELEGTGFTATLFSGYKAVSSPFTTAQIKPGGSTALSLKMAVNAGQPQDQYVAKVQMRDPLTDEVLDQSLTSAQATYQTGTTAQDIFLKTGSQPFVGGSDYQFETASTIKPGGTATFTIRLKNDSTTPTTITLLGDQGSVCADNFAVTVKQGFTDVTAAVIAGNYSTGILNPGAKKELKLSVKLIADDGCRADYFQFQATGPDGALNGLAAHVVIVG